MDFSQTGDNAIILSAHLHKGHRRWLQLEEKLAMHTKLQMHRLTHFGLQARFRRVLTLRLGPSYVLGLRPPILLLLSQRSACMHVLYRRALRYSHYELLGLSY